jgi:hypothetical protein
VIVTPDGAVAPQPEARPPRIDNALVKALARAFRWRRMLESGDYGSIADLARAEKIGRAHVSTMPLLAPDIVEAILDGRQGGERHAGGGDGGGASGVGGARSRVPAT